MCSNTPGKSLKSRQRSKKWNSFFSLDYSLLTLHSKHGKQEQLVYCLLRILWKNLIPVIQWENWILRKWFHWFARFEWLGHFPGAKYDAHVHRANFDALHLGMRARACRSVQKRPGRQALVRVTACSLVSSIVHFFSISKLPFPSTFSVPCDFLYKKLSFSGKSKQSGRITPLKVRFCPICTWRAVHEGQPRGVHPRLHSRRRCATLSPRHRMERLRPRKFKRNWWMLRSTAATPQRPCPPRCLADIWPRKSGKPLLRFVFWLFFFISVDWLIDWLIDQLSDWYSMAHWPFAWLINWLQKHEQEPDMSQVNLTEWLNRTFGIKVNRTTVGRTLQRTRARSPNVRRVKKEGTSGSSNKPKKLDLDEAVYNWYLEKAKSLDNAASAQDGVSKKIFCRASLLIRNVC